MMKSKDVSISMIRLISLIMIITCHIFQGLGNAAAFWFNLGVQIFFFMSGYLYGYKDVVNIREWYIKQAKKILIPYMILCIIMIFIDGFFFNIHYGKIYILGNLLGLQGFIGTLRAISHTWFVSYILLCYLITPLLQMAKINTKSEKQFVNFLLIIAIFLQFLHFFNVTTIMVAWIYNYIIGYYYSRYYIKGKIKNNNFIKYFTYVTLLLLIIRIILQYNLFDIKFGETLLRCIYLTECWSHVLLGSCIFIWLYIFFKKLNLKYNNFFKISDKYSYYIYLVHQIFILNYMSLLKLTSNLIINILLIIVFSVISGIILFVISTALIKLFAKLNSCISKNIQRIKVRLQTREY